MTRIRNASSFVWDEEVGVKPKREAPIAHRPTRTEPPARMRGVWLDPIGRRSPATTSIPATAASPRGAVPRLLISAARVLGWSIRIAWTAVTLPFRILVGALAVLGRLVALVMGFGLMVFGAALFPTVFLPLGIAVFSLGLVMMLRSVE
ncbi:MAG: hypothetical protein SFX72_16315 [Isosphaeraceae bacterium]|nr:hypothetical protein [Isosphaeraceae bacterium]